MSLMRKLRHEYDIASSFSEAAKRRFQLLSGSWFHFVNKCWY